MNCFKQEIEFHYNLSKDLIFLNKNQSKFQNYTDQEWTSICHSRMDFQSFSNCELHHAGWTTQRGADEQDDGGRQSYEDQPLEYTSAQLPAHPAQQHHRSHITGVETSRWSKASSSRSREREQSSSRRRLIFGGETK